MDGALGDKHTGLDAAARLWSIPVPHDPAQTWSPQPRRKLRPRRPRRRPRQRGKSHRQRFDAQLTFEGTRPRRRRQGSESSIFENRIDCACCTCRAPPSQAEGRPRHRESGGQATARYEQAPLGKTRGQVSKGTRWMPWYQEAMKDVGSCEKLRGAATQALIRRSPNGKTRAG